MNKIEIFLVNFYYIFSLKNYSYFNYALIVLKNI